jgi:hypothetical protein
MSVVEMAEQAAVMEGSRLRGKAVAFCCGRLDGMSGQVLTVDPGTTFFDNTMRPFDQQDRLGI